ncbi:MAG: radical SAM protein [Acidobacteria bacterium]|nr:radical SAM protein [Acidobacteriota bacterium]
MQAEVSALSTSDTSEGRTIAINEIFVSIQGESTHAGRPCVFLRTMGCPLRCTWCDTEYAFYEGSPWTIDALVEEATRHGVPLVQITGGEPLAQAAVPELAQRLLDAGMTVLVETSGSFDISVLPDGVRRIMDLKCPGSGEVGRNDYDNLDRLRDGDEVKFVVAGREDYEWARDRLRKYRLEGRFPLLFSPVWDDMPAADLAAWILEDQLDVRLQLQLHKILWPNVERGV